MSQDRIADLADKPNMTSVFLSREHSLYITNVNKWASTGTHEPATATASASECVTLVIKVDVIDTRVGNDFRIAARSGGRGTEIS